ncbi:hypothetical protein TCDM_11443 [Trypanosoma cruzi Dm28c]|uniref:Uncharacterized protein n=1 Tax=Trypanosoma cruzi Dm28c TaxID=1416333 RepID=V5B4T2_TRYCR|nr:hypothetical protein TCDM_11443 [Trypanosoma cruzi Dm28c]
MHAHWSRLGAVPFFFVFLHCLVYCCLFTFVLISLVVLFLIIFLHGVVRFLHFIGLIFLTKCVLLLLVFFTVPFLVCVLAFILALR